MRCYGFAESAGACYSKQTFVLIDIFRQGLNLPGKQLLSSAACGVFTGRLQFLL